MSGRKVVWMVIESWDREGLDEPIGVFSTKEKAEKAAADFRKSRPFGGSVDVYEYEMNASKP